MIVAGSLIAQEGADTCFFSHELRREVLDGILSWLANQDGFDPPQEDDLLDETPEFIEQGPRRKAFGELGAALRLAQRAPALRGDPRIAGLARYWTRTARHRNLFFDIRRRPYLYPQAAVALAVLAALKSAREDDRRLLQSLLDRGFMDRIERSAWDKLDLKYYFEAAGLRSALPDYDRLAQESSLSSLPALPHARKIDLYGLTHLIFHLSDFGSKADCHLTPPQHREVRRYVRLALAASLAGGDHDLAAELLISRLCLGDGLDGLCREAGCTLAEAQHSTGFVPARRSSPGGESSVGNDEFAAVYHPTIVALFLIAAELGAGWSGRTAPRTDEAA